MRIISAALSLLMVLGYFCAHAETYYVSSTGNDENSGFSKTSAWASIDKVNSTLLVPGDTVLFEGEVIFTGSLYFAPGTGGTASMPIVLGSFGSGRAVISSGSSRGFVAYNTAGLKLQDLVFQGAGRTIKNGAGVDFYLDLPNTRLAYIALQNVEVYGYQGGGIKIGSWKGDSGFDNVSILNCSVHDNGDSGINTYAEGNYKSHRNFYIAYCKAYNNAGIPEKTTNTGSGIVMGGVDGGVIEFCEAYNNGWLNSSNSEGPVGIWCYLSNNVTIQYNESHHNRTGSTKDGGGFDIDGGSTNCVLQYNYSHHNDGPGYLVVEYDKAPLMQNLIVRYNISENDARKNSYGAIHLWASKDSEGIQNAQIYHNTIYVSPTTTGTPKAVWVQAGGDIEAAFRNNLFITTGSLKLIQAQVTSNVRFEGNNYWSSGAVPQFTWGTTSYNSLEKWRTATGQEMHKGLASGYFLDPKVKEAGKGVTISDPKLLYTLNSYRLEANSPMIGKALDLTTDFGWDIGKRDFWGNSLIQRKSLCIGAHQVTNNSKACLNGGTIPLTFALAEGGNYKGKGIIDSSMFDPASAGIGNHPLTYHYTDRDGQPQVEHHTVSVLDMDNTNWTGGSGTSNWSDSQNWSGCVPTPFIDATIPASIENNTFLPRIAPGERASVRNLAATGTLSIEQSGTLEVHGSLAPASLATDPLSLVIFKKSGSQEIPAGTYGILKLDGQGPTVLTGNITIANQLDLNQSKLALGKHTLFLDQAGTIVNYSPSSYIITSDTGMLTYKELGPELVKVFPVGTAKGYAPVTLHNKGASDNFSIRVTETIQTDRTESPETRDVALNKTWYIEEGVTGGSNVDLSLQWSVHDESEAFDRYNSYATHYEDGLWQVIENSKGTVSQGKVSDTYSISLGSVNSFSPFTVASYPLTYTPLPVTLSTFTAKRQGTDVLLEWTTASERNNYGFEIERARDGEPFEKLGFIPSKSPESNTRQIYSFRDNEVGRTAETRYYRLRQIDRDGNFEYSFVRAVTPGRTQLSFSIYPNPFQEILFLELEVQQVEQLQLTLRDPKGNKVYQQSIPLQQGVHKLSLDVSSVKNSSFYFLTATVGDQAFQFKLLRL